MSIVASFTGRAGRTQPVIAPPEPPVGQTFAQWVDDLNDGAGPDHYWLLDDASAGTVTTEVGGLTGTHVNSSDLEFGITDAAGEKLLGFGGTNGALNFVNPITTAAFTFIIRLQVDAAPGQMTIATSGFSNVAGQYLIQLDTDGAGGLKTRKGRKDGSGVSVIHVDANPATVPVASQIHLIVQYPASGAPRVWVHDIDAGTVSEIAQTLSSGTVPGSWSAPPSHTAFIGSNTVGATTYKGLASHMIVCDLAIPEAEILALANVSPQPEPVVVWARALTGSDVPESTTVSNISVLNHIRPSTGFTLEVVDGTGTRGTLSTPDNLTLRYAAGAVTGNQVENGVSWRISKTPASTGIPRNSPTVGFTCNVLEAGTDESAQANCHIEGGNTVVVSTMAAMQTAVDNASPGDQILIAPGTFAGGTRTFNRDGTEANPIVIRPRDGLGTVTITGATWAFANTASWLTISKLNFESSGIQMLGDHNRVTRCQWRNITKTCINFGQDDSTTTGARNCRVDHCDFTNVAGTGNIAIFRIQVDGYRGAGGGVCLVDYNYFHDVPAVSGRNITPLTCSFSELQNPTASSRGSNLIWDHNLVKDWGNAEDSEHLTTKLNGMIIRYSTFLRTPGQGLQMRMASYQTWQSNWLEGLGSAAFKVWGKEQWIIGNRFIGNTGMMVGCGVNTFENVIDGILGANPPNAQTNDDYCRCHGCRIIGNRLTTGVIEVGRYFNATDTFQDCPALDNVLEANTRDAGSSAHVIYETWNTLDPSSVNTFVSQTTSESFTPAVQLAPADVGLNAADPLCS